MLLVTHFQTNNSFSRYILNFNFSKKKRFIFKESKITFFLYGLLCLVTLVGYVVINHFLIEPTDPGVQASQLTDEPETSGASKDGEPTHQNKVFDTNYYYQPSNSNDPNQSQSQLNSVTKYDCLLI